MDEQTFRSISDRLWSTLEIVHGVKRSFMGLYRPKFTQQQLDELARGLVDIKGTLQWLEAEVAANAQGRRKVVARSSSGAAVEIVHQ